MRWADCGDMGGNTAAVCAPAARNTALSAVFVSVTVLSSLWDLGIKKPRRAGIRV